MAEEGAELGVIPLENSIEGTVGQVVDLFMKYTVHIQAEIFSKISHSLMSNAEKLEDVEVIYSHPQPLGQCREWLRTNMRDVPTIPLESTAEAAEVVAQKKAAAVVGHVKLADMHGMNVLAQNIEGPAGQLDPLPDHRAVPFPGGQAGQDHHPVSPCPTGPVRWPVC